MKNEYCKVFLEGKTVKRFGSLSCEQACPYGNQISLPGYGGEEMTICSTQGKKHSERNLSTKKTIIGLERYFKQPENQPLT